jgi:hypothetical protein
MTPTELLSWCRSLGVDLARGARGTLIWEADDEPPPELLAELAKSKASVLEMMCESCGQPLDEKGRCWRCCDRRCHCGRQTRSAFVELCYICANNELR